MRNVLLFLTLGLCCLILIGCTLSKNNKIVGNVQQVYLVRHAEKAQDGTKNPDLTDEGAQRAERLATLLADRNINAVFSTNYLRTTHTAKPTASLFKLNVLWYEPIDFKEVLDYLSDHPEHNVLVVGHSNTTPALANLLLGKKVYNDIDELAYGQLFSLKRIDKQWKCIVKEYE